MAARANLTFLGQEDIELSSDPQVTYFVEKYQGQTLFTSRVIRVQQPTDPGIVFGTERYIDIPNIGDLVTKMYLKIRVPDEYIDAVSVIDSTGTLALDFVELYVGSQLIERISGEFISMKYDVEVPTSKQGTLSAMIGKTGNSPTAVNSSYTIPLPFSILEKGLPLCAIQQQITFRAKTNPSSLFIYPGNPDVEPSLPLTAELHCEYTYISDEEIRYIRSKPQIYLFQQLQLEEYFASQGTTNVVCQLDFTNPVSELYFVIQNDSALGYDYGLEAYIDPDTGEYTQGTSDQLSFLTLLFNGTDRISVEVGTPLFLRVIQGLEFHTRVPDGLFYMYSFSLDPESPAPTGHVNFSRIKNQVLNINLVANDHNRYIRIYAVSYNFLLIQDSDAILMFPNS